MSTPSGTAGPWLSGASGEGVTTGAFDSWRGTPVAIAASWSDASPDNQVNFYQLDPTTGGYRSWQKNFDIAVGAIFTGETWGATAAGAYDSRWRQSLTNLKIYPYTRMPNSAARYQQLF